MNIDVYVYDDNGRQYRVDDDNIVRWSYVGSDKTISRGVSIYPQKLPKDVFSIEVVVTGASY